MNTKAKIALGILAGGSLLFFGLRRNRRNSRKSKTFTAPDGNTYSENQIYKTFDNKLYKNGKQIHFPIPDTEQISLSEAPYYTANENISKEYKNSYSGVIYHQKGTRHR
ncbi:hypothetical protein SAMN05443633_104295 [Chryseobacterium arachidis]|uniref:Uncharacterized protein n=1 Tax=Chryseobacterium arachidis TaxID=1416778 RepID=A0A1M5BUA3_9FLAO|nr:hypothetical protein [Chryseobacterium arachidis]SHF46000.1 hypothetical protein SAMN05443633_104295 [Chryseobacterium arachidis]